MAEGIHNVGISGRGDGDARRERPGAVEPRSTDEARRAVEETRSRISATLDAIETRLDTKKDELKERFHLLEPVQQWIRQHRWRSLGIAFGIGLAFALLTGGEEEEVGGRRRRVREALDEDDREERRRWRAERRERLRRRQARQRYVPLESESELGRFGRVLTGAVVAGLGDRLRRRMQ